MSTYFVQGSTMDAIADAINAKTGGSSAMTPAQMVTAIGAIPTGGSGLTQIGEYTQAEDWITDTLGNSLNFRNTYFPTQLEHGVYIARISGNTQSGIYGQEMVITNFSNGNNYGYPQRYTNIGAGIGAGTSFYVIAGATIKVYFGAEGVSA